MRTTCRIYACLALLTLAGAAQADDGMPALLQFAEQYQQKQPVRTVEKPASEAGRKQQPASPVRGKTDALPAATPHRDSGAFSLRRELLAREQQLARQQAELNTLRQEVAQLRTATPVPQAVPVSPLPEPTLLRKWTADLGRAWRGTPDEARLTALTGRLKKDLAGARQEAETARRQADVFRQQAETVKLALEKHQQADWQAQDNLRNIIRDNEQKLARQETEKQAAQKALQTLQAKQKETLTTLQLAGDRRLSLSYAAGSALGRDIQSLLEERKNQGVTVDRQALLAGVTDRVTGHLLLPPEQLEKLQEEADRAASTARTEQLSTQQRQGQAYQAKFSKQKGVQKSAMGFWYRVDYAGKGKLTDDTVVDVVVKEQLTDGTVIQDMELSGKVLSQPLSAFPPLFREAMGHLQDHGSLTMVVPPELAYGDTGYPPKVPPGATMVYELRIDNSQPPPDTRG